MANISGYFDVSHMLKKSKTLAENVYSKWDGCEKHLSSKNIECDYLEGIHLILSNLKAMATRRGETGKGRENENVVDTDQRKVHLDRKHTERDYLEALSLIQRNTEIIAPSKRQMENGVDINAEADSDGNCGDDTDGETDLQYEHFLANLEEHGNSYALKVENNGVSSLLTYGEESSSDDASGFEGRKRKMIDLRPKDVLCAQKLGFLNITKSVNKKQKFGECSTNVMDLPVREDLERSETQISVRKRDAALLIKNQVKFRKMVTRKNIADRNVGASSKVMAQIEYGHVHLTSDQSGSVNKSKGPEKLQKVAKRMIAAKIDHVAKKKSGQKKKLLSGTTVKCENETPAEKEKIQRKNIAKSAKGKNVDNLDHEGSGKEMTLENETHLSLKSSANSRAKGVSKKKVSEANSKIVVQIGKQLFYRKPGFGNNCVKESCKDKACADNKKSQDCGKKLKGIDKRVNVISGTDKKSSIPVEQYPPDINAIKSRGDLKKVVKEEKVVKENNTISVQKTALKTRGRPKKVVKEEKVVKENNMISTQKTALRQRGRQKKQIDYNAQVGSSRQSNNRKFPDNNHDENNQENEVDDGVSSDVEILHNSEEVVTDLFREEDFERILCVDMDTEYAKKLMSILKKPFDDREYRRLSGCVQIYYKTHPSLRRKMIKYRYKTAKRLNILRGFFYWLQYCIAEGAFKPWEEKKCLAVE